MTTIFGALAVCSAVLAGTGRGSPRESVIGVAMLVPAAAALILATPTLAHPRTALEWALVAGAWVLVLAGGLVASGRLTR